MEPEAFSKNSIIITQTMSTQQFFIKKLELYFPRQVDSDVYATFFNENRNQLDPIDIQNSVAQCLPTVFKKHVIISYTDCLPNELGYILAIFLSLKQKGKLKGHIHNIVTEFSFEKKLFDLTLDKHFFVKEFPQFEKRNQTSLKSFYDPKDPTKMTGIKFFFLDNQFGVKALTFNVQKLSFRVGTSIRFKKELSLLSESRTFEQFCQRILIQTINLVKEIELNQQFLPFLEQELFIYTHREKLGLLKQNMEILNNFLLPPNIFKRKQLLKQNMILLHLFWKRRITPLSFSQKYETIINLSQKKTKANLSLESTPLELTTQFNCSWKSMEKLLNKFIEEEKILEKFELTSKDRIILTFNTNFFTDYCNGSFFNFEKFPMIFKENNKKKFYFNVLITSQLYFEKIVTLRELDIENSSSIKTALVKIKNYLKLAETKDSELKIIVEDKIFSIVDLKFYQKLLLENQTFQLTSGKYQNEKESKEIELRKKLRENQIISTKLNNIRERLKR